MTTSSKYKFQTCSASCEQSFYFALILSFLLHLLLVFTFFSQPRTKEISLSEPIKVSLLRPTKTEEPPEQIVSPSQSPETDDTVNSVLLSDKNTLVKEQTLKRGQANAAPSVSEVETPAKRVEQKKELVTKQEKADSPSKVSDSSKKVPILRLSQNQLQATLPLPNAVPAKEKRKNPEQIQSQEDYTPFRPSFNPSVTGRIGSPDYLPSIQDGEVTLLNAKANRYAVFVRRVAIQVFGVLRRLSWTTLTPRQIYALEQFTEVRAVLRPDGTLLSVQLAGSSGVAEFDSLLFEASKQGAWDKNPPEGAQSTDGNIHFVFRSKTWSRPSARGVGEQRWLLLSTGLL